MELAGTSQKPVYNMRSDGRDFRTGRCLVPIDGFYEFTKPTDPKAMRKHKWLFTRADDSWFCLAGLWRAAPDVGEAFTLLTTEPGPDIAPYHNRQVAVLHRADWSRWLDPSIPAAELLKPLAAGTLDVSQIA